MFITIIIILFFAGAANVIWQSFYYRVGVASDVFVAQEEKTIGLDIVAAPQEEPTFTYLWAWKETLPFYAGKPIPDLPDFAPQEPYYLIVPAELFKTYAPSPQFSQNSQKIFSGQYLELYRVGEYNKK